MSKSSEKLYLSKPLCPRPLWLKTQTVSALRCLSAGLVIHNGWPVCDMELVRLEKIINQSDDLFQPQSGDTMWVMDMWKQLRTLSVTLGLEKGDLIMSLEASAVFAYQIHRSKNLLDCVTAVMSLIHGAFQKSVTSVISTQIIDKFREIFVVYEPQGLIDDFELPDAEKFFTQLRSAFDFTAGVSKIPIMMKLHKFVLYVLSFSLLDKVGIDFATFGYPAFEAEAVRKAHLSKAGFWLATFDALSLFCKQFVCSVKSGSFTPFLHSETTYEKWCLKAFELKRQEQFISNPAPHGFNIFTYRADYNEAIEHGECILRTMISVSNLERERFKALLNDLKLIKGRDITRRSSQMEREAPFGLLLAGGSSVGKSHLTNILHQYYADLWDLPAGSDFKYTRNFTEEFWNGFTTSMWFVVLDDIASWNPALGVMDPSMAEVIQVMNNVAFVPNQADLVDKGKTPLLARFVIATTNTPDLNAHAYFSCPLAIQRRLPFVVEVEPKVEFAQSNGIMLDASKCALTPGMFNDYWELRVSKVIPSSDSVVKQRGKRHCTHTFQNIDDFLIWFGRETQKHHEQQLSLLAAEKDMKNIKICRACCAPQYSCRCGSSPHTDTPSDEDWEEQALDEHLLLGAPEVIAAPFWTFADWESLLYTIFAWIYSGIACLPLYTFPFCFIAYLCPGFGKLFADVISYFVSEERFMRFLMRRLGERTQKRFSHFIVYGKILALAIGMAYVVKGVQYVLLPKPMVLECAKCIKRAKRSKFQRREPLAPMGEDSSDDEVCVVASKMTPQTALDQIGKAPKSFGDERTNVWYKEDFNVTSFDVNTLTASWKDRTPEFVRNILFRQLVRFRLQKPDNGWKNTGGLALGGQLYAFNLHSLPMGEVFSMVVMTTVDKDGVSPNIVFTCTRSQIVQFPNCDLAIVHIPNIPPRRDITRLLATETFDGKYTAEYLSLNCEMSRVVNPISSVKRDTYLWHDTPHVTWQGYSEQLTMLGDCGGIMVTHSPSGPVILGLHALGSMMHGVVATLITKEMVDIAREQLGALNVQSGEPRLNAIGCVERSLLPLDKKSTIRWQKTGVANVYGSISGHRAHPKSSVARTVMANCAETHGYKQQFGQPEMKSWKVWSKAIDDLIHIPMTFRLDILEQCVESFSIDILNRLTEDDLASLHVYDMFTAVNGAAGVAYVDKLKRNTSAGFPWCKSKKFYLHAIEARGELMDPVEFSSDIVERVQSCIEIYETGTRCMPIFMGHLKDEPTKWAKITDCKTRVFCGGPQDIGVVTRMYFLAGIRLIQNNRFIFESGPGTIAQSPEWGGLRDYLIYFGVNQIVAGDFKAFDKSMSPIFILAAFRVLRNLFVAAGYSDLELAVVDGISLDTAFPLIDLNGDLIEIFGSNPSGHSLTVIINGLAHSLYMRYCYFVTNPLHEVGSFKTNVHLLTYGDDGAMGISKDVSQWFNHTSVQTVLAKHGVIYTMADKTSMSIPLLHISQISFLKRTWVWSSDVGAYLCPLDHESIEKSIMTCVVSKSVSPQFQGIAILSSAWQEYFFYGKEEFERRSEVLLQIVKESGLESFVEDVSFPSWDELVARFFSYPGGSGWRDQLALKG